MPMLMAPSVAGDIGTGMVNYLKDWPGHRLGGGECAHLVTEALRVAGGEYVKTYLGNDSPSSGDYVWGTLIKKIEATNGAISNTAPGSEVRPGDIIQYRNAKFSDGRVAAHHTEVVRTVTSDKKLPADVFTQNSGGNRFCQIKAVDIKKLTSGWLRIYRPIARGQNGGSNKVRFSVVNYCPVKRGVRFGGKTYTLDVNNTAGSYITLTGDAGSKVGMIDGLFVETVKESKCYYMETKNGSTTYGTKNP